MMSLDFEYVLQLARQLKPEEQSALAEQLQSVVSAHDKRAKLLSAFSERVAHAQSHVPALHFGRFADPAVHLSTEQLNNTIKSASTAWEDELDDLRSD